MATPDTRNSILIVKEGPFRGGTNRWSNRYHFEGDVPPDATAWEAFADAIVDDEKVVLNSFTSIVEAIGNNSASATSTNPHGDAVWEKTYSVAGTGGGWASSDPSPGEAAALVRYSTPARSSKNHPVYLFNYYHSCYSVTGEPDSLSLALKSALEEYAEDWLAGFSDGHETHERCGPRGAVATSMRVDPFVRHRDFPN